MNGLAQENLLALFAASVDLLELTDPRKGQKIEHETRYYSGMRCPGPGIIAREPH